eukprot:4579623-Prymnesium_polylepis.1
MQCRKKARSRVRTCSQVISSWQRGENIRTVPDASQKWGGRTGDVVTYAYEPTAGGEPGDRTTNAASQIASGRAHAS